MCESLSLALFVYFVSNPFEWVCKGMCMQAIVWSGMRNIVKQRELKIGVELDTNGK